jgi:hypothetical protein
MTRRYTWLWLAAAFLSPFGAAIVSWAGQQ